MGGFKQNVAFLVTVVKSHNFNVNLKIFGIVLKTS